MPSAAVSLDLLFTIAMCFACLGVACIALARRLPLPGADIAAREEVWRMWSVLFLVAGVLVTLGTVVGADLDGDATSSTWAAPAICALAILVLAVRTVRRTRTRVAEARRHDRIRSVGRTAVRRRAARAARDG